MKAKQAVATIGAQPLTALGNGYHGRWQRNYAGVAQRWLLVRSEQSQPPRAADIGQNLLKDKTRELKAFA